MKRILFVLFALAFLTAQADTISVENSLQKTLLLLKKSDSLSVADSISRIVLLRQIDELRSSETSKREKLRKQLQLLTQNDSLKKIQLKREVDSLKMITPGYAIVPYRDTLFYIYTSIGSVTAAERSRIVNERIKRLYHNFFLKSDSIHLVDYGQSVDLMFNEQILVSITEADAMWLEKNKHEIATIYKQKILENLLIFKKDKSFSGIAREVGLALLVIILQFFLIRLTNRFFLGKIRLLIESKKGIWFKSFSVRNYEILDAERLTNGALFLSNLIRYLLILVQLFISIPIVFSIFPPTRRFAETMFGYLISPVKSIFFGIINYIPELMTIIVIVVVTRYVLKFIRFLLSEIEEEKLKIPGFYPDWAKTTYNLIKIFVIAFAFIVIFQYLPGSDSDVFKGVSVFLGIVFSLGSSSIIGNMIAGLVITYMRPFKIGDRIKIGDVLGDVVEKTPFVTRIKTPKKEFITIPNSNILSSNVINYSTSKLDEGIILHTTVTIGYDVPWRQVHQLLLGAAKKTQYISSEHPPFVLQTSLDDFYVSYQLNATTNEPTLQPAIYSELHQNIQDAFNEAGVEIMSPHYRAARDGNATAIPSDYLPPDYKTPGFRVENNPDK